LAIAVSMDHVWSRVTARTWVGLAYLARGEIDDALQVIRLLIADGEQAGHPANLLGRFYLAWLYFQLGAASNAVEIAHGALDSATGLLNLRALDLTILAWHSIQSGELDTAGDLLAEVEQSGTRQTLLFIDLVLDLAAGGYLLARRDYAQAGQVVDDLVHRLQASGLGYFLPYALHLKSQVLEGLGRADEARASLKQALETAEAIQNRILRWRILAELGEQEAAGEIASFISGHISDSELRQTFLAHSGSTIGQSASRERPD
jgi:tetratricopeptide (TPR) repeat protein